MSVTEVQYHMTTAQPMELSELHKKQLLRFKPHDCLCLHCTTALLSCYKYIETEASRLLLVYTCVCVFPSTTQLRYVY